MCGPSNALKAINKNIQQFATTVQSEASDVFDASSSVFHNIMNAVTGIVKGGPSQYGFSAGEQSAKMAAATMAGAAEARNLKGAAASSAAAVGGGNVVAPAGSTQEAVLSADQRAASDTAMAKNVITQQGFEKGYDEWKTGLSAMEKAPDVFNASTAANQGVTAAQHEAETSQTNIDNMSNWAMNDIMKLGTAAVTGFTSGGFGGLFKSKPASAPTSVGNPG
jgi:hypothetical protein